MNSDLNTAAKRQKPLPSQASTPPDLTNCREPVVYSPYTPNPARDGIPTSVTTRCLLVCVRNRT